MLDVDPLGSFRVELPPAHVPGGLFQRSDHFFALCLRAPPTSRKTKGGNARGPTPRTVRKPLHVSPTEQLLAALGDRRDVELQRKDHTPRFQSSTLHPPLDGSTANRRPCHHARTAAADRRLNGPTPETSLLADVEGTQRAARFHGASSLRAEGSQPVAAQQAVDPGREPRQRQPAVDQQAEPASQPSRPGRAYDSGRACNPVMDS